jgi:PAS domain S-box-containing protein
MEAAGSAGRRTVDGDGSDLYRSSFDASPDAVLAVDAAGRILHANARVTALFGYEPEDLVGEPVEVLLPELEHAQHTPRAVGHEVRALQSRRRRGSVEGTRCSHDLEIRG